MNSDETAAQSYNPDDWVTAAEALRLVRSQVSIGPRQAIAKRAHAGLLRSRAARLRFKNTTHDGCIIPAAFWWAHGEEALEQNWAVGDFSTWINREHEVEAFGVCFHRGDLAAMIPGAFKTAEPPKAASPAPKTGGRPLSVLWPDWVAELAAHLHEKGIPEGEGVAGQEELISAVETSLAERGLEAPSRATVQGTVRGCRCGARNRILARRTQAKFRRVLS